MIDLIIQFMSQGLWSRLDPSRHEKASVVTIKYQGTPLTTHEPQLVLNFEALLSGDVAANYDALVALILASVGATREHSDPHGIIIWDEDYQKSASILLVS